MMASAAITETSEDSLKDDMRHLRGDHRDQFVGLHGFGHVRVEARAHERVVRSRADLIESWRTRLFSQSIGALVSVAMFVVTLAGVMQPAYRTLALASAVRDVILGDDAVLEEQIASDTRLKLKVLLLQPPPPPIFTPPHGEPSNG